MTQNVLCLLGFHAWGDWIYRQEDTCDQIRTCKRSENHHQNRELHDWEQIKKNSPDPVCPKCGGKGIYYEGWVRDPKDKYPTVNDLPPEAFEESKPIECRCSEYRGCRRCKKEERIIFYS